MSTFDPHGTTILCVRRGGLVAMGGDGQVTLGTTVLKLLGLPALVLLFLVVRSTRKRDRGEGGDG